MQSLIENWVAGGAACSDQYDGFQSRLAQYPKAIVQPIFDADQSYIRTLLNYVNETYDGFENYAMKRLGFSNQVIKVLRENLLE